MTADAVTAFLERKFRHPKVAIDGSTSTETARDIFAFLCSRAGRDFALETLKLGKDSIEGLTLGDISKCITNNVRLKWLEISVRNYALETISLFTDVPQVPERTNRMTITTFAGRINKSQIKNLCLQDASDSFAEQFFPILKRVDRVDLRQCAFTSIASQHIFDYLKSYSKLATFMEIVLSGCQLGFKMVRAVSLRQFRLKKDVGVELQEFLDSQW